MFNASPIESYGLDFENIVAEYCTGDICDRSDRTLYETYIKVEHCKEFLQFCQRYLSVESCRFLEVGCGTAAFSVAAAILGAKVSATDFAEKAMQIARMRWAEHRIEGDLFASDLRVPPSPHRIGVYNFVTCYQVIEHIPRADQFTALANLFAMVAPGGFLFIDTENNLAPFDRHDSRTWLLRYLSKPVYEEILMKLGRGLNHFEVSTGDRVETHDYLSYDELIGAALVSGFEVASPFMPHGDKAQMLRTLTGSDWLHDSILRNVDIERFSPISLLLRKRPQPGDVCN